MVLELVDEKGLRRARPVQRQRVDRAHRPGAPGSKQQGAAVRRDVTSPLVLRRHQQRLGRARAVGGNPVKVPLADLAAPPGPTKPPSATGPAGPVISRRDASNGTASSVPLRVATTTKPEET